MLFIISSFINFNSIDFSTIFFFTKIVSNGNMIFKTLYTTTDSIFFIFLMLLLLFAMIAAITTAMLTRNSISK